jgi:hypothetical protein
MTCDNAQQNLMLAHYGELPDELHFTLEQHLTGCEDCRREWNALQALEEELALGPVLEPSPNFLTASRLKLDEALDAMPPRSLAARLAAHFFRWMGNIQSAPALTTLLIGLGFLGGNFVSRYQAAQTAHAPRTPGTVVLTSPTQGAVASVSDIVQTPNSDFVQVKYNRMVPESIQGSLDDPQIRQILMLGTKLATTNEVHASSLALLAAECRIGHQCEADDPATGAATNSASPRSTLMVALRYDKNADSRLHALEGLQPYIAQDQHVRDAVLEALMTDQSTTVRTRAVGMLQPVQADASVREVLRTVSTQDVNPAIRNASVQALQGTADIE